jgi:hypothetical protein
LKKSEEEAENQKKNKMDEARNGGAIPSATIVNIPIHECTPLNSIPGNFSYSSQLLELEDVVVVVGEYYYNNKTKGIEKISNKRKRIETSLS